MVILRRGIKIATEQMMSDEFGGGWQVKRHFFTSKTASFDM